MARSAMSASKEVSCCDTPPRVALRLLRLPESCPFRNVVTRTVLELQVQKERAAWMMQLGPAEQELPT